MKFLTATPFQRICESAYETLKEYYPPRDEELDHYNDEDEDNTPDFADGKRSVYSIELYDPESDEAIENMRYSRTYHSPDVAIKVAKHAVAEYEADGRNIVASVYEETEAGNGSIYGEPELVWSSEWESPE